MSLGWAADAVATDVEAALESARRVWPAEIALGDAWFRAAVRAGDLGVMHGVIEYIEDHPSADEPLLGVWKRRAGVAGFPRVEAPHIHVALSTFAPLDESGRAAGTPDSGLVVQAADPAAAMAAVGRTVERSREDEPALEIAAVRRDELGAHLRIESGPRFAQLNWLLVQLIDDLRSAGVRAAYIRPESAEPWLPPGNEPDPTFPEEIAAAAERAHAAGSGEGSGEAAFSVGLWCQNNTYRQCGDVWFKKAAARSPFGIVLRIIDQYATENCDWNGDRLSGWMARAWRLEFPRVDAPEIRVDGGLFAPIVLDDCAGYGHHTSVQVLSNQPDAATRALRNAAPKFCLVTADGRAYATQEEYEAAQPADDGDWAAYYTPNLVSDIEFDGPHPYLWMDWKDNMAPRMAHAMTHILVNELRDAGVGAALIRSRPEPTG